MPVTDEVKDTATPAAGPEDFAEFEKWRETGEMPEVKAPEAPAATPEKTEGEAKTAPAPEPEVKQEETEGEVPEGVQKRIDKAVRRQREAERRAEALEAEVSRLKATETKPAEKPAPVEGKPKVSNFADYDEYVEALAEWKTDQRLAAEKSKEQSAKATEDQRKALTAFSERVKEVAKKPEYADIDEVLDSDVTVSAAMHEALLESDKGAELAYYLGKHPEDAARIAKLSPTSAARELGKIEASLSKPPETPKPKASAAPPPMKPVGGKSAKTVSLTDPDVDYADWERKREAELRGR